MGKRRNWYKRVGWNTCEACHGIGRLITGDPVLVKKIVLAEQKKKGLFMDEGQEFKYGSNK